MQLEEQATSDYLLKVFRASIPHMPKTTAKFGHELQLALQPMIIKPNGNGIQVDIFLEYFFRIDPILVVGPARKRGLHVHCGSKSHS